MTETGSSTPKPYWIRRLVLLFQCAGFWRWQHLAVHFAIRRQRQAFQHHQRRGHHVDRQSLLQASTQLLHQMRFVHLRAGRGHHITHQLLVAVEHVDARVAYRLTDRNRPSRSGLRHVATRRPDRRLRRPIQVPHPPDLAHDSARQFPRERLSSHQRRQALLSFPSTVQQQLHPPAPSNHSAVVICCRPRSARCTGAGTTAVAERRTAPPPQHHARRVRSEQAQQAPQPLRPEACRDTR
jgi:hypothetical protein